MQAVCLISLLHMLICTFCKNYQRNTYDLFLFEERDHHIYSYQKNGGHLGRHIGFLKTSRVYTKVRLTIYSFPKYLTWIPGMWCDIRWDHLIDGWRIWHTYMNRLSFSGFLRKLVCVKVAEGFGSIWFLR